MVRLIFILLILQVSYQAKCQKKIQTYYGCNSYDKAVYLELYDNSRFSYMNFGTGGCWTWNQVSGSWKIKQDTIVLSYEKMLPLKKDDILADTAKIIVANARSYVITNMIMTTDLKKFVIRGSLLICLTKPLQNEDDWGNFDYTITQ